MLISTALLLDSIIRNSVCTPAKLPCRRVEVGYENYYIKKGARHRGRIFVSNNDHSFESTFFYTVCIKTTAPTTCNRIK
jgi:hypothetical protein